jgi:hypothetical protein
MCFIGPLECTAQISLLRREQFAGNSSSRPGVSKNTVVLVWKSGELKRRKLGLLDAAPP